MINWENLELFWYLKNKSYEETKIYVFIDLSITFFVIIYLLQHNLPILKSLLENKVVESAIFLSISVSWALFVIRLMIFNACLISTFLRIIKHLNLVIVSWTLLPSVVVVSIVWSHIQAFSSAKIWLMVWVTISLSVMWHLVRLWRHQAGVEVHLWRHWIWVGWEHSSIWRILEVLFLVSMFIIGVSLELLWSTHIRFPFNKTLNSLTTIFILWWRRLLLLLAHILTLMNWWSRSRSFFSILIMLMMTSVKAVWCHWHAIWMHHWWETETWVWESIRIHLIRLWWHSLGVVHWWILLIIRYLAQVAIAFGFFFFIYIILRLFLFKKIFWTFLRIFSLLIKNIIICDILNESTILLCSIQNVLWIKWWSQRSQVGCSSIIRNLSLGSCSFLFLLWSIEWWYLVFLLVEWRYDLLA